MKNRLEYIFIILFFYYIYVVIVIRSTIVSEEDKLLNRLQDRHATLVSVNKGLTAVI